MSRIIESLVQPLLKKYGLQVIRYPERDIRRRLQIIDSFNINTLLDVGANRGQYALQIRSLGYEGRIISFEPTSEAFELLKIVSNNDDKWEIYHYGLGDLNEDLTINLAANSASSSILDMTSEHIESASHAHYTSQESIQIKVLDDIFDDLKLNDKSLMIKIDTQGYEKNVLVGSLKKISKIKIVQLEMSLTPLYVNESLMMDLISYMTEMNFSLYSLENGHYNIETGRLLQVDGIFVNNSA